MKKFILIILLFLSGFTFIHAQNKVNLNFGGGAFLKNSENSMKIMDGEKFRSYLFYGLTFQKENIFGYNLMLEYNYNQSPKDDIISFAVTDAEGNNLNDLNGDFILVNHNFDLDCFINIHRNFSIGIGPSFVITNRIIDMENLFYDKLASSGLGVNGFVEFSKPLSKGDKYFYFTSKLKMRYTHSIWFDEGLRKLDDYSQEFITTELSIGIGYSF